MTLAYFRFTVTRANKILYYVKTIDQLANSIVYHDYEMAQSDHKQLIQDSGLNIMKYIQIYERMKTIIEESSVEDTMKKNLKHHLQDIAITDEHIMGTKYLTNEINDIVKVIYECTYYFENHLMSIDTDRGINLLDPEYVTEVDNMLEDYIPYMKLSLQLLELFEQAFEHISYKIVEYVNLINDIYVSMLALKRALPYDESTMVENEVYLYVIKSLVNPCINSIDSILKNNYKNLVDVIDYNHLIAPWSIRYHVMEKLESNNNVVNDWI